MPNAFDHFSDYQRAIAKGHLCSCGADYQKLDRPIIAVVNSWNEIVAGHAHLRELAAEAKQGIIAAGGYPLEFNTIAICDGITQSHDGMKYVLPSREVIADSIELMIAAHGIFDGMVLLGSCDKIVPAMLMAAARLNIPAVMVTGGTMVNCIPPHQSKKARQQFLRGELDEKQLVDVTLEYYPSPGICPFLGTANTMCIVAEALGMGLPGSGTIPAMTPERSKISYDSGVAIMDLVKRGVKPRDIMTKPAFDNAITIVLATGGSLNSVLHLPAIAHECGLEVTLDDFDRISRHTPFVARVYPNSDEYTVADLDKAGGTPTIVNQLRPLLVVDAGTVNGRSLGENCKDAPPPDGKIIRPLDQPFSAASGLAVLQGNLAPEGAVVKSSAVAAAMQHFTGPARVFECEEDCMAALYEGLVQPGQVIVIRNEGPIGGPGMREMHRATEVLNKIGNIAIITDGRFSGASYGLAVGYLSPEAAAGGPIALVQDGDTIEINIPERILNCLISEAEWALRRQNTPPSAKQPHSSNFLRMYSATSLSTANGAVRRKF
ncbi:MAG: dihydroxy-acid dehydratase [Negativicutes bacterium]|nr:dihydroxy-acid dehydratase [Negativicutes bacterium]